MAKSEAAQTMQRTTRLFLYAALTTSILIAVGMPFKNEDLILALCSGQDTWNGLLASPDHWSFVTEGKVWVDQSWLSHLLFFLSYALLGELGPVLLKGCLLIGVLVILYFQCRALHFSNELSILAMTLGTLSLAPFLNIRAHNFAMLYFVALSSLLVAPASRGRWSQLASIVIMAVWSNSHGSFMLGFGLIGLRFLIDAVRSLNILDGRSLSDPYGWLVTLAATIPIMAFANPYGPENLLMPFRQFLGTERTVPWADWLPLIYLPSFWEKGLYRPFSAVPYIALVCLVAILAVATLYKAGFRGTVSLFKERPTGPDSAAQILICLMTLVLALKFQRLIVIAAPSMVPVLGLLLQVHGEMAGKGGLTLRRFAVNGKARAIYCSLAVVWALFCTLIFYRYVVIPRLPSNPLNPPGLHPSIAAQLMNYNLVCGDVAEFMKRNRVAGRIVGNLYLSDYLLFHVPGIQVFADLRAHSAYSAETIETIYWLLCFGHEDPDRALAILDRYKVSYLVLDTRSDPCAGLINELIRTQKWGCVYKDTWIYVLARADSEKFGQVIATGNLSALWYNESRTRIVTRAILSLSRKGILSEDLLMQLRAVLTEHPDPDTYDLLAAAGKEQKQCLNPETRTFLDTELRRLATTDFMVAGGARSILASMLRIIDILSTDDARCRPHQMTAEYGPLRDQIMKIMSDLWRHYHPW